MNETAPQGKARWIRNVLCILAACLAIWYFVVPVWESVFEMIVKVDTVRLDHGYSVTIYQDKDIHQLYAALSGPRANSPRTMLFGLVDRDEPRFEAGSTADGTIGWVVAANQPSALICVVDYRNGDYWFRDVSNGWNTEKEDKYLAQINTDGCSRGFKGPYFSRLEK